MFDAPAVVRDAERCTAASAHERRLLLSDVYSCTATVAPTPRLLPAPPPLLPPPWLLLEDCCPLYRPGRCFNRYLHRCAHLCTYLSVYARPPGAALGTDWQLLLSTGGFFSAPAPTASSRPPAPQLLLRTGGFSTQWQFLLGTGGFSTHPHQWLLLSTRAGNFFSAPTIPLAPSAVT
jgi:hypothetical protein